MLVDANILLFARDEDSPFHDAARTWLEERLGGSARVGLPWASLLAFVRIATNPRAYHEPLEPDEAWAQVRDWLSAGAAWIPEPTRRHPDVLGDLIARYQLRGPVVADAHLVALAIEHGLTVCSADGDFARFPEVRWNNPVVG